VRSKGKKCKQRARTDCAVIEAYDDHVIVITFAGTVKVNARKVENIEVLYGLFTVEECKE